PIELRSYLTAPELGAVPFVWPGECVPRTRDIPLRRIKPDESSPYPIPWTQNAFADSLRASLASILRSNGKRSAPKLILVTSPAAGDGKTTMVSSLGLALAEVKDRVLLIDADTRNPSLHKVFGVSNSAGLTNMLNGDRELDDCILQCLAAPR